MQKKKLTYTVEEATKVLEKYCVYQDRCHFEVNKRLMDLNMIPEACEQIILHLMDHNFLNEERFAKSFARGKFRIKKWGKIRIVRQLMQKEISDYHIKLALKEIDPVAYKEAFWELVEKKVGSDAILSWKDQKKLNDYLIRQGYEYELIQEALARYRK